VSGPVKNALRELGDEKEHDDADQHRGSVVALARLGLGLRAVDLRLGGAPASKQVLTANALSPHGQNEKKSEHGHENARKQFDDDGVDPEVGDAQSGVDRRRVRLTRRCHDVVHRPVRQPPFLSFPRLFAFWQMSPHRSVLHICRNTDYVGHH